MILKILLEDGSLITAKNFVCPSLFMAEELRKKGNKPGYINLIGLEIMNWQKIWSLSWCRTSLRL